jgi:serine/threonine-protein kinase
VTGVQTCALPIYKSQIIHRDIKPGNILVTPSGLAKLSDLGLAKRRDDPASLTHATQGIGTPYYMPYEQAMNAKMADERSDIYALGATLYHLLTGEVPFPGESSLEIVEKKAVGVFRRASEINTEIPVTLDEILTRMLARDPASRYQTASDVIVDLERSHLAAKIPSFVQIDSALQDPVVVERLTSPVETTQPDLQLQSAAQAKKAREQQIWFLRYRDPRGNLVKAKGSAANVLERIKNGTIPANAEASLSAQGKFKPLGQWPEFQTGLAAATSREPEEKANPAEAWAERSGRGRWLWLAVAAAGIGAVGLVLTTVFLWVWN